LAAEEAGVNVLREAAMTTARALDGQVAMVTGGGKGIGRAIALQLSASGARVLVTGRDERALAETVGEIAHGGGQARHVVGDVRDEAHSRAAAARAIDTWGALSVVVANAGLAGTVPVGGSSEDVAGRLSRARAILDTNLLGTYLLFDAALAVMPGPGRLVAISSVLGKFGAAGQAAYCAAKAGLHGLVRAVAIEAGPRAITCNAVCPGWVDTEMARARLADLAAEAGTSHEQACAAARAALPMRRFVEPEEVARFVVFLCSRDADAITGQALSICSGATTFAG
jgi:3-hydroxybutyrate dehydrogenase